MSLDDDRIREALSAGDQPYTAHAALRALRPSMQRSRRTRRIATSATAAALLVGGGVGVAALAVDSNPSIIRTVTSDATAPAVLPTPSATTTTTVISERDEAIVARPPQTVAPTTGAPGPTPADPGVDQPTEDPIVQRPPVVAPTTAAPTPTTNPPPPQTTNPPPPPTDPPLAATPPPAPTSVQTITSDCGDVVVTIDSGTVRIVSIAALPGFTAKVADDGPTSIEVTFRGVGESTCEVHAELKSGRLEVEVQGADR